VYQQNKKSKDVWGDDDDDDDDDDDGTEMLILR